MFRVLYLFCVLAAERVVKPWHGLLREVVESAPLKVFRKQLDMALSALVYKVVISQSLDSTIEGLFQSKLFCDSVLIV